MKTVPRVILIAAFLVLSVVAVLPASAGHSLSPAVFHSGINTPTSAPPATSTSAPPATSTSAPPATSTSAPPATNTPLPTATYMPSPPYPRPTHMPPPHVPPGYPPPAPPQPVYPVVAYWTVQPGQTLYCIGRYYKVSPWAIASANRIPWPYFVYPGQVLAIPNVPWYNIPPGPICYPGVPNVTPTPPSAITPTPPAITPTPPNPSACRYYHTVQWGQTLSRIAWYYHTTIQAIMYANPSITNPNLIYAGSVLCIP
jgi:LysM repeat protein